MRTFCLGEHIVDLASRTVRIRERSTDLSPIEARLLGYLAARPGEVVSREELLREVWGYRLGVRSRAIDKTTNRLRPKIEPDPLAPRHLLSVYGQGLKLDGLVAAPSERQRPRLIGRDRILDELAAVIRDGERLVAVWGPGGSGKSRLVEELGHRIPLETVIVDCGFVQDGSDVDLAVARALGLAGARITPEILDARGSMLLALDTCESGLAPIAERVLRWLPRAPRLRVLLASRLAPGIEGERRFALGPLEEDDAIALFCDRASARGHSDITPETARHIVSALDGLPLAVELAAARLEVLGVRGLLSMLETPLDLLCSGQPSVVERSWRLLSEEERAGLRCAALFEGPFGVDDLAAVAGLTRGQALVLLESLFRCAMARRIGDVGHTLYRLVRERARTEPDDALLRDAKQRYVSWLARLGDPDATWSDGERWALLERATPDLRAAVAYADALGLDEQAARCGLALGWCGIELGPASHGLEAVHRAARRSCSRSVRVALALAAAQLSKMLGDSQGSLDESARACALASSPAEIVQARCASALARRALGDREGSKQDLDAAAPLADEAREAAITWLQARADQESDPARIEPLLEEAIRAAQRWGDRKREASSHVLRGYLLVAHHRWGDCRRSLEHALALCGDLPHLRRLRASALLFLGHLERRRGDLAAAEHALEEACALAQSLGLLDDLALNQIEVARVWHTRGWRDEARARLAPALTPAAGPSRRLGLALLTLAEIEEASLEPRAALEATREALEHGRSGQQPSIEAMALDLLALLTPEPSIAEESLARAAMLDDTPDLVVRRRAIASLVARAQGAHARADAALAEASRLAEALDLLPEAEALVWVRRARRAARGSKLAAS